MRSWCNHSGTLPLDAVMTAIAVHDNHPKRRHLRMLGDLRPLAWLRGPLCAIPLPSKWYIEFGRPIRTDDHRPTLS